MPHQCTTCGRDFADGSKEMLSGCPDCGGTKFQYLPDGGTVVEAPAVPEPPEPGGSTVAGTVGRAASKARDLVGDAPAARSSDEAGRTDGRQSRDRRSDATVVEGDAEVGVEGAAEDGAQSSARTEMVDPGELPDGPRGVGTVPAGTVDADDVREDRPDAGGSPADEQVVDGPADATLEGRVVDGPADATPEGRVVDAPSAETPDLADLREKLDDQFEGIRILDPGQYELNLMELYEREETIVALRENGRYVIVPPESWHGED